MLAHLELLICFVKGYRSFHTGSIGSVGQRAANLLAFKVRGLKKMYAVLAIAAEVSASAFGLVLSPPRFESFLKFDRQ